MQHFSIGFYDEKHIIGSFMFAFFNSVPGAEVIFNTRDELALIGALNRKIPDVLFMNLMIKNQINHVLVEKINVLFPALKTVGFIYGTDLAPQAVFRLVNSGVVAILTDAHSPEEVGHAVQSVIKTGFHLNDVVNEATLVYSKRKNRLKQSFGFSEKFTEREIKIIEKKKAGKTSKEIAGELFLSKKTVDGILQSLYMRFECRNLYELIGKYEHQLRS